MKRYLRVTIVLLSFFLLTGCIDVLHYVGVDGNGTPVAHFKLTLEKAIFQWAASMGGEDMPATDEEFEKEFELSEEEVTEDLPEGVKATYSVVNTKTDFGFQLDLHPSGDAPKDEPLALLPFISSGGDVLISLPVQESENAGGEDEGDAFLASAKYRLIVGKEICPDNPRFVVRNRAGEVLDEPEVLDVPEVYVAEFPLMLWLSSQESLELAILAQ